MRTGVSFSVLSKDRQRLEAVVADGNSPQKHVWRARIVLLSDAGFGTSAIMRETGKSKTCVWRWQERFMAEGVDGPDQQVDVYIHNHSEADVSHTVCPDCMKKNYPEGFEKAP